MALYQGGKRHFKSSRPIMIYKENQDIKFGDNEYEKMLLPMISRGLPKSMLEGFMNRADIRRKCMYPPKAILSAAAGTLTKSLRCLQLNLLKKGPCCWGCNMGVLMGC